MKIKEKYHIWIIIVFYLFLRLIFLTKLPIFNDESIYLDWANRIIQGQVLAFYSLYDGTQPLLLWVFGLFTTTFSDPLFAGRLVSVIAGLITLVGLYKLSGRLFGKNISILTAILFIVTPLFSFYDRQALMESSISAIGIWTFYFLVRYLAEWKLSFALLIGILIGIGFFIKTSAVIFFIPLLIIGFITFFKYPKKRAHLLIGLFVLISFFLITIFPLVIQSQSKIIYSESNRYVLTLKELSTFPIKIWFDNLRSLLTIFMLYIFPTTFIAFLLGVRMSFVKNAKDTERWLYIWLFAAIIVVAFIAKSLPSRYIVSFLPLAVIPAAVSMEHLQKKYGRVIPVVGIVLPFIATIMLSYKPRLVLQTLSKVETVADANTYVYGFPSGYGIAEARMFLEEKAKDGPILIGVRLDSGNPESAILAYYGLNKRNQNIEAIYFDSQLLDIPQGSNFIDIPIPFYFISRGGQLAGLDEYLIELKRFYKPDNEEFIGIYTLR